MGLKTLGYCGVDFECTISRGIERTNGDHYLCEQGKKDIEDAYVDFINLQQD